MIQMKTNRLNPDIKVSLEAIGKKIRKLRKERSDLDYIKFADQLKADGVTISKNTLQRIESGTADYGIQGLLLLLNYYKVSVSDFFSDL
jgi:transcriptional regulator with XRE-family HTH domain